MSFLCDNALVPYQKIFRNPPHFEMNLLKHFPYQHQADLTFTKDSTF